MKKPEMIVCECCTHVVSVEKWNDEVCFSMWGKSDKIDHGRLFWAWQALKGDYRGVTDIILDDRSVSKLIDVLKENDD